MQPLVYKVNMQDETQPSLEFICQKKVKKENFEVPLIMSKIILDKIFQNLPYILTYSWPILFLISLLIFISMNIALGNSEC